MQKLMCLISKPVAFILLVSFSFNASGQSISAKMEKDFRVDARIKVSQAAQVLNTAVDAYEKSGPKAFADSFGSILNPEEKAFVIKELKGLPPFPRLKMEGDKLVVFYKKEIIAQLESYDVAQGIFEGGPFHYTFDNNLGLIENLQSWKALDKGSAQNEQHSRFLMNLFIPQAEARVTTKWAIPIIGAALVLGVLIGNWLGKPSNSTKVADANAAKTVEPPPSSTNPTHGGGTPAAGDGQGNVAASAPPSTRTPSRQASQTKKGIESNSNDELDKQIAKCQQMKNYNEREACITKLYDPKYMIYPPSLIKAHEKSWDGYTPKK